VLLSKNPLIQALDKVIEQTKMKWKEKFKVASGYVELDEDLEQDFYLKEFGANDDFISMLRDKYPYISEDYIYFLKLTDGADIAQCTFFSSTTFSRGAEMYSDIYPDSNWFPFGHEAGGDPLMLHNSGKVAIGHGKSTSGEFNFLANSFSDFLNEIIMGPRYPSIFRLEEKDYTDFYKEELEEDPWLAFLIEQKWINV
jgi:hypothetical protein